MSADDMYELSLFIVYYLNLYKDTTNIYKCGVFVQKIFKDYKFDFIIGVIHIFLVKERKVYILEMLTFKNKLILNVFLDLNLILGSVYSDCS